MSLNSLPPCAFNVTTVSLKLHGNQKKEKEHGRTVKMLLSAIFNAASFSERAEEGSLSPAGYPHAQVPKFIDQL